MAVKNPYEPPTYGVRNLAIERRLAGKPPASEAESDNKDDLPPLSRMTKAELIDLAKSEAVEIETDDNKADLVRKIEESR